MNMTKTNNALAVLIGGAIVVGSVVLLAWRTLRSKSVGLADADLSAAEWQAQVEFEASDED